MNHSFYSADRATHRRVIAAGLGTAVLISLLGFGLQSRSGRDTAQISAPSVIRAGKPVTLTANGDALVR